MRKRFRRKKHGIDKKQSRQIAKLTKLVGRPEIKQRTGTDNAALAANTPVYGLVSLPAQGLTSLNRIGNRIKVLELQIRIAINSTSEMADALWGTFVRSLIYSEKSVPNTVAGHLLFGDSTNVHLAPPNVNHLSGDVAKYLGTSFDPGSSSIIHKDKTWVMSFLPSALVAADAYTFSGVGTSNPVQIVTYRLKFPRGHDINFSANSDPVTVADVSGGQFGYYFCATSAGCTYTIETSMLYTDC